MAEASMVEDFMGVVVTAGTGSYLSEKDVVGFGRHWTGDRSW
ncbi:MAG TPA: hypothetical protein VGM54_05830 [Chthoniobacter sp.]